MKLYIVSSVKILLAIILVVVGCLFCLSVPSQESIDRITNLENGYIMCDSCDY